MRRATVLVLAVLPFLGTTLPAALKAKLLKTHDDGISSGVLAMNSKIEPDTTPKQHFEYILPGSCVAAIEKTPAFKCSGPDRDHLKCQGISLTIRGKVDECLEIHVEKEK